MFKGSQYRALYTSNRGLPPSHKCIGLHFCVRVTVKLPPYWSHGHYNQQLQKDYALQSAVRNQKTTVCFGKFFTLAPLQT